MKSNIFRYNLIFNVNMKKKLLKEIIGFGFVGILNTLVCQVVYMICVALGMHYVPANVIGLIISVFHAYLWQTKLVFKEDEILKNVYGGRCCLKPLPLIRLRDLF